MPPHQSVAKGPHLPGSTAAIVTESGPLKGIETSTEDQFLGIPYAASPVGNLRWMPPQPHGPWQVVLDATQFGNYCTQPDGVGGIFGDENCLTLNVYRPHQMKNANNGSGVPVMVWVHGGAFTMGGPADYDPSPLVLGGNVIVVTINYRLGYLGFLAHSALDAEGHLAGNYGLMDQQFALRWVQNNIAAFGGDPQRVTIFGQSAGADSVDVQLASLSAAGLFARAIAESPFGASFAPYLQNFIVPLAVAETSDVGNGVPPGTSIALSVGCASQTAQCLRSTPASTLVLAEPGSVYPFIDATLLTQTPGAAFASGQFNRVPVIYGTNHDEWRLQVAQQYGSSLVTEADYETALEALWDGGAPFVLPLYPLSNYPIFPPIPGDPSPSPGIALGASGTDGLFSCPARNADQSLSEFVTTYTYELNDEHVPTGGFGANFPMGAFHIAEMKFLFNGPFFGGLGSQGFDSDQFALSNTMIGYWTTFAATGNPNFSGAPLWSPYNSSSDGFLSLVPPAPVPEFNFATDHKCTNFWG
jgi:para-nitrobenzyl esterase